MGAMMDSHFPGDMLLWARVQALGEAGVLEMRGE
jgi:hypothetical protein